MGGLLSSLNTAKSSLSANQKAVEVIGNNIANVNTPGYSRETPTLTPYPSLLQGGFFVGQGVNVTGIARAQDTFLTGQINDQSAALGEQSSQSTPLAQLEQIFSVSNNNLSTQVDDFFSSWQSLSENPSGATERNQVILQGQNLAQAFNSTSQQLDSATASINSDITSRIDNLNAQLKQVAALNSRIQQVESAGQSDNSDRDQRDQLIQGLSQSLGVKASTSDGTISLSLPNGLPLVQGGMYNQLTTSLDASNNVQLNINLSGNDVALDQNSVGGEMKGLLSVRDTTIPALKDQLDTLAYNLSTSVNTQQQSGAGLNSGATPAFFTNLASQSGAAAQISVAITDSNDVAAGAHQDGAGGTQAAASGDNTNALAMFNLGSATISGLNDTFDGYYSQIVSDVGVKTQSNTTAISGAQDSLTQLQNLRDSVAGVSVDDEMVTLIQYQQGYQASAQYLTTVNQMMDTLLSLKS